MYEIKIRIQRYDKEWMINKIKYLIHLMSVEKIKYYICNRKKGMICLFFFAKEHYN